MCWGTLQIAQGVGSAIAGAMGQDAAAERQNAAYLQNAANANASASEQYAQNYLRQIQEEAAAAQERIKTRIQTMKNRGAAIASSENSGSSMWSALHDIERQGARDANVTGVNLENTKSQLAANTTSIYNEAQQRIDSMPAATGADPVAAALNGLGVVVGIAGNQKLTGKDFAEKGSYGTPAASDWRDGGNAPMDTANNNRKFVYERSQRAK